jgi:Tfp pilus assembly protein PilF
MNSVIFLKIEIFIFISSFLYILYFLYEKILIIFWGLRKVIKPDENKILKKIKEEKEKLEINKDEQKNKKNKKIEQKEKLTWKDLKRISELLKRIKLNKAKWYFDKAKTLVVEWLAIDKSNKELNLELADIYEQENEYNKAEFIYKDLLWLYKNNFEILKKLGYNLALQWKYEESVEVYLNAYNKKKDDIEIVEFLADLTYQLKFYKKSLKFIKIFLKEHPRNSEKLKMKAFCLEALWEVSNAIDSYKKVLELQPYNTQVQEKISFLEAHL